MVMSAPTKEVSGILPIPEEIRLKSTMQLMMPEPPVKKRSLVLGIVPRYKICCCVHPYCCRETIVLKSDAEASTIQSGKSRS